MKILLPVLLAILEVPALAQYEAPPAAKCDRTDVFAAYHSCGEDLYRANAPDQSRVPEGATGVPVFYHSSNACSIPMAVVPIAKDPDRARWKDVMIFTCGAAYTLPNPEVLSNDPRTPLSPFNVSGEHCKGGYRPAPTLAGMSPNGVHFELPRITQSERNVARAPLCTAYEAAAKKSMDDYFAELKGKDLEDARRDLAEMTRDRRNEPGTMFVSFAPNEPHTLASYGWAYNAYDTKIPCYLKPMPASTDDASLARAKEVFSAALATGLKNRTATLRQQLQSAEYRAEFCKSPETAIAACAGVGSISTELTALKEFVATSCAGGNGTGKKPVAPEAR